MRPPTGITPDVFLAAVEAELMRRAKARLADFVRLAWPHFEANRYVPGRHVDVLCDHLEAVNRGECPKLVVNLPPRHSKSNILSVCWPAWTWLQGDREWALAGPWVQFLFASHSFDLAVRDSRRCRALVQSRWYQDLCEGTVRIREDSGTMHAWELSSGGARRSTSVDSRVTGWGADVICVDDLHDVREVESAASREAARVFWQESLPSRVNNPRNHARVLSGQRVHARDVTAVALEEGGWGHLCLPGLFDPDHPHRCPEDWRDEPGEPLWPERFPTRAEYDGLAGTAYARASQVQQLPQARGAGIFRGARWEFADDWPRKMRLVRYWDKAATAEGSGGDPDYTAGVLGGMDEDGRFWIVDIQRGRWSSHQVEERVRLAAHELDPRGTAIYIEEEPGSAGKDVTSYYQRRVLPGFPVRGDRPTGKKLVRVDPLVAAAEAGNVVLVRAVWNRDFLDECETFTGDDSTHDDQVVAAAGCYARLSQVARPARLVALHGV